MDTLIAQALRMTGAEAFFTPVFGEIGHGWFGLVWFVLFNDIWSQ